MEIDARKLVIVGVLALILCCCLPLCAWLALDLALDVAGNADRLRETQQAAPSGATSPANTTAGAKFSDDFSDNSNNWYEEQSGGDEISVRNGVYRMFLSSPGDYVSTPDQYFSGDVRVQVDTETYGPDNNDFGLVCRYQSQSNFYFALISTDGYYGIGIMDNGNLRTLTGSGMSLAPAGIIRSGTNRLRFECVGSTLTLYVNDNYVASVTDNTYTAGGVGVMGGAFDEPGVEIHFDNFEVR